PAGAAAPGTPASETGPACSCDARQYASAAPKWSMIGRIPSLHLRATGPGMAVSTLPSVTPAAAEVSAPAELVQHWIGGRPASGAGAGLPVFNPATGAGAPPVGVGAA